MTLLLLLWSECKSDILKFFRLAMVSALSGTYCFFLLTQSAVLSEQSNLRFLQTVQFLISLSVYCFAQLRALDLSGPIIENTVHAIRTKLICNLQEIELRDAETIGTSRIVSALSSDTLIISQVATPIAFASQSLVLVGFAAIYLGIISMTALVLTLVVSAICIWAYLSHSGAVREALHSAQIQASEMQEQVTSLVAGFKELKLSRDKAHDAVTGAIHSSAYAIGHKLVAHKALSKDFVLSQLSLFVLLGTIVFVMPVIKAEYSSIVMESVTAVMFLISPLFGLIGAVPQIAVANVSAINLLEFERLFEELKTGNNTVAEISDISDAPDNLSIRGLQPDQNGHKFGDISLEKVRFEYNNDHTGFSVGPISLNIRQCELVFITGSNGSGKTTLFKILTGLYCPTSGQIISGNNLVWPNHVFAYRSLFAVVFSDFYLFKKLNGVVAMDPDWTKLWLDRLQLSDKVTITDGVFSDTRLSTGQRKRLALFAALAEKRPILILDEWAADQDPAFRRFFYHDILPFIREDGITVIAITHDEAYFDLADRRLHLENGALTPVND